MRIKDIVKVEKMEIEEGGVRPLIASQQRALWWLSYNQGQEDYGNKKVGLDLGKIKEILKSHLSHVLPWKSEQIDMIILALKDREDEIIVEVK